MARILPDIPRRGALYEDIDAVFALSRRIFNQDQADRFEDRVEQYNCIKNPSRRETKDFQSDIKVINEES